MSTGFNPYSPPEAEIGAATGVVERPLASRAQRFVANLIDGLLYVPLVLLLPLLEQGGEPVLLLVVLLAGALTVYQWYLTATTGQTLGKSWVGIRIVRNDGTPVNFASGVILRSWLVQFIATVPLVGTLFAVVNVLCIFNEERRCLHDYIAGTKVVTA